MNYNNLSFLYCVIDASVFKVAIQEKTTVVSACVGMVINVVLITVKAY